MKTITETSKELLQILYDKYVGINKMSSDEIIAKIGVNKNIYNAAIELLDYEGKIEIY